MNGQRKTSRLSERLKGVRRALRSTTGAIDLASIMVGVLVIGIIGGVISSTVVSVIPWTQDSAARQNLDATKTAEGVARAMDGTYQDSDTLATNGHLRKSANLIADTDAAGTCWLSLSASATGAIFWSSDKHPSPQSYVQGTSESDPDWCVGQADVADLISKITGKPAAAPLGFSAVTGGQGFSLAIGHDGHLYATGQNGQGQLGLGAYGNKSAFTQLPTPGRFIQIAANDYNGYALDSNKHLWAWGYDGRGSVGDGGANADSSDNVLSPVEITPTVAYKQIAAAAGSLVAIDTTGHLWGFGYNDFGQVGVGGAQDQLVPVAVQPDTTFAQVAAGSSYEMALDTTGNVWAWGFNNWGNIGNGFSSGIVRTPVKITTPVPFTRIASSGVTSYGFDSAGNMYAWGDNTYGEYGDGTTTSSPTPVAVATPVKFTNLIGTYSHVLAQDAAGHIYTWGYGNQYTMGDGTANSVNSTPIAVTPAVKYTRIGVSAYGALAVDTSGNIWAWGINAHRENGSGSLNSGGPEMTTAAQ